jgi:heptosyltransferase-2/heptosyltransferase-3
VIAPIRVAVLKPCCFGDCVLALPALDALAAAWPAASLDVFVGDHSRAVFEGRDTIAALHDMHERIDLPRAQRLGWRLRRGRYDCIVVLDRSRGLRLAATLARPLRLATARGESPETRHEAQVYLDALKPLGIDAPLTPPRLTPSVTAHAAASALIPAGGPYAVLHPGGAENPGASMPEKRWPVERFAALARWLCAQGVQVRLSGGPGDIARCHAVAERAGLAGSATLAGRADLATAAAVVAHAALYVGPDTGLSHIAAAVGAPTVAIFGPTNPRRYRPLGELARVVAAPGSCAVPDADLRRSRATPSDARIELVDVAAVQAACDELLRATACR